MVREAELNAARLFGYDPIKKIKAIYLKGVFRKYKVPIKRK